MTDMPAPAPERPIMLISGGTSTETLWGPLAEHYDLAFLYPQAAQQAQAMNLRAAAIATVTDGEVTERAGNQTAKLTARVVNGLDGIQQRLGAVYGPSSPSTLTTGLSDWFSGFALHLLNGQVLLLEQLEALRNNGRVLAGCVVHEDVAADTRAMVNWCNAHGIPTIHVPHAPCHLLPGVPDIHRETRARWIAASGEQVARFYTDSGHDPAFIRVTGAPQWDGLYEPHPEQDEARRVLAIDHAGPVICYQATWGQTTSVRSGFETEFEQGWRAVLEAAHALGAYVVVKIHYHDQRPDMEDAFARDMEAMGVPGLATRQHFHYCLRAADVVVAQGPSNVCLDAAILGVPACYIQTEGFDYATPLPLRSGPEGVEPMLRAALMRGLDGWDETITAYNYTHVTRGGAAANVVEWVREICQ